MKDALLGVKIIDLTRLMPGPFGSWIMADLGAEVICIQAPNDDTPRPDKRNWAFDRNKRSMTLNLRESEGKEIFFKMIKDADVVMEGFRPGVVKKLGIDYEAVKACNPGIIYCSISGYGQTGKRSNMVGHDINYVALSGILGLTGERNGKPVIPGIVIGDLAGGIFGVIGILAALHYREKTGKGQYIDVGMLDALISLLHPKFIEYYMGLGLPARGRGWLNGEYAWYNVYEAKDKKYISIAALEPKFWNNLCKLVGREDLLPYQMRKEKQEEMFDVFQIFFRQETRDEWVKKIGDLEICFSPVLDWEEVLNDEDLFARQSIVEIDMPNRGVCKQIGFPIKMSLTAPQVKFPPLVFGESAGEILSELGYAQVKIDELRSKKIV